jgi:hypothetical protein
MIAMAVMNLFHPTNGGPPGFITFAPQRDKKNGMG